MRRNYMGSPITYSNKKPGATLFLKTELSPFVFSNLLSKIDKNSHSKNKTNKTAIFEPHRGSYCKIQPYELRLKDSEIKMLDISQFMSNRKNKQREQIRYQPQVKSLNNSRSLLKKQPLEKVDPENKVFTQEYPKILSGTCKVSPIIMAKRPLSSRQRSQNASDCQDNVPRKIRWSNSKVKSKQRQELEIMNFQRHNEQIEPWAFKNNESFML